MSEKLNSKDVFPALALQFMDGKTYSLPADIDSPLTVFLVYRGHW